jgi:hypothetical protein
MLGDSIYTNPLMLGYAWQQGRVPLGRAALMRAIELNGVQVDNNKAAFEWGRRCAHDLPAVQALFKATNVIQFVKKTSLDEMIGQRVAFLTGYQDAAYAARYKAFVDKVRVAETQAMSDSGGKALTEAVARYLFKLMAYKDEYEVARLHTDPAFVARIAGMFEGEYKLVHHLAPPGLAKTNDKGELVKQPFGPWVRSAFGLLARMKGLRGGPLDFFGRSEERRTERALIGEYEGCIDEVLKTLNAEDDTPAELGDDNAVLIGGHRVGRLDGLKFTPDAASVSQTLEGRALRHAALKALRPVIERRLMDLEQAADGDLSLAVAADDAPHPVEIVHAGAPVARLKPSSDWLSPSIELLGAADAHTGLRTRAETRLIAWLQGYTLQALQALFNLRDAVNDGRLKGLARGVGFQLVETGAALDLRIHGPDQPQAQLNPADRRALKEAGVSSGRLAAFLPGLLRPGPATVAILLRCVHGALTPVRAPTASSFKVEGWHNRLLWTAVYLRLGPRAVRADMAERLSFALTQARRASDAASFIAPPELAALIGCPLGEFEDVLRAMGLKPAERNAQTRAVTRWRFPTRRTPPATKADLPPPPPATGPFAALAQLRIPAAEPAPAHRKRRRKRKAAPTPPAAAE